MLPAILFLVVIGGFGVYKYIRLHTAHQKLVAENAKLNQELFNYKYIPREQAEQKHAK